MQNNTIPNTPTNIKDPQKPSKEPADALKTRPEHIVYLKKKVQEHYTKVSLMLQIWKLAVKHFLIVGGVILLWVYVYQPVFWDQILLHGMHSKTHGGVSEQLSNLVQQEITTIKDSVNATMHGVSGNTAFLKAFAWETAKLTAAVVISTVIVVMFLGNHTPTPTIPS